LTVVGPEVSQEKNDDVDIKDSQDESQTVRSLQEKVVENKT
jgi:hypothetical protein